MTATTSATWSNRSESMHGDRRRRRRRCIHRGRCIHSRATPWGRSRRPLCTMLLVEDLLVRHIKETGHPVSVGCFGGIEFSVQVGIS